MIGNYSIIKKKVGSGMKIELLPNLYLNDDGTFDKDRALNLCGKIAGVCYDKEGFSSLENELEEKTNKRIELTLNSGHHSVYDHIFVNLNIHNIPKILAMVINNEKQYTTSEKSARYTEIVRKEDSIISSSEEKLYNEWTDILVDKIKSKYPNFKENKIIKLAHENARYFVTVFMPTEMIYTVSFRQINYIVSFMERYIKEANTDFEKKLAIYMEEFISELDRLNLLDIRLQSNEKNRKLSLFGHNLDKKHEFFGDIYSIKYCGSFAELAQAQRHRTINYQIEFMDTNEYFIPPIIKDNSELVNKWVSDMDSVKDVYPQGILVKIYETGTYDNFILKCKERVCSCAQLEICNETYNNLLRYRDGLKDNDYMELYSDISKYTKGARCTYPDYKCNSPCGFKEGINITREI